MENGVINFAVIGTSVITDNFLNAAMQLEEFKLTAIY